MDRPGFVDLDTYLKLPREAETWLIKPLIPAGGSALLYGDPKVGKSYLGIQLSLALSGQTQDWLGFSVAQTGKVLYLQLDTPRSVWAARLEEMIKKYKVQYDPSKLLLADRDCIEFYPFDILQPTHTNHLKALVAEHKPVAVIIDTLREVHSGDEDSSTIARNVVANLVSATSPAALLLISHARKPHPDIDKDLLADNRGSSYITGRMDAIIRLTKTKLWYTGRSIEQGDIKMERQDSGMWLPTADDSTNIMAEVLADTELGSMRSKARALAARVGKSEEACMSMIRRTLSAKPGSVSNDSNLKMGDTTASN